MWSFCSCWNQVRLLKPPAYAAVSRFRRRQRALQIVRTTRGQPPWRMVLVPPPGPQATPPPPPILHQKQPHPINKQLPQVTQVTQVTHSYNTHWNTYTPAITDQLRYCVSAMQQYNAWESTKKHFTWGKLHMLLRSPLTSITFCHSEPRPVPLICSLPLGGSLSSEFNLSSKPQITF